MYYISDIALESQPEFLEKLTKLKNFLPGETERLSHYAKSNQTLLISASSEEKLSAVIAGLPLDDADPKILQDFSNYQGDLQELFLVGDIAMQKEDPFLRKSLLNAFEALVRSERNDQKLVIPAEFFEIKPKGLRIFDRYWLQKGYQKYLPPDAGRTVVYWIKSLR